MENYDQYLFFFGSKHSYNPLDSQFEFIEKEWKKFIELAKKQSCIVLVEGNEKRIFDNKNDAIINSGEGGYITYLAFQENIDTVCPEPFIEFEVTELLKKFTRDAIILYRFMVLVGQYFRQTLYKKDLHFGRYIRSGLNRYFTLEAFKDFDFSPDNLKNIYKDVYGKEFDFKDVEFFRTASWPKADGTIVNEVSRESMEIRDQHIVSEIHKLWKEGKNIFAVFGLSHLIRQKPILIDITKGLL